MLNPPKLNSIIGSSEAKPPTINNTDVKIRMCLVHVIFVFTLCDGNLCFFHSSQHPYQWVHSEAPVNDFFLGSSGVYDIFMFLRSLSHAFIQMNLRIFTRSFFCFFMTIIGLCFTLLICFISTLMQFPSNLICIKYSKLSLSPSALLFFVYSAV